MTLIEQATRRIELARAVGAEPQRWVASPEVAKLANAGGQLLGLPIEAGRPRSDWGLDLVLAPRPWRSG